MSQIPSYLDYSDVPNGFFTKTKDAQGNDPYKNERDLFSALISEAYNKHGVTMTYYSLSFNLSADPLNGEDNNRTIMRQFDTMAFFTLPREDKLWSRFGIENMDTFSIFISKRHFNSVSQFDFAKGDPIKYDPLFPKIGDLIRSQYNNFLYEVTDVKEEAGMFLISKAHVWELILKPYRDEHLSLSASTSADMGSIAPFVDKDDPFNISGFIKSKEDEVMYNPPPTEKPTDDFWS